MLIISIITEIEYEKALTIFRERQEYLKGYYAQKKKELKNHKKDENPSH